MSRKRLFLIFIFLVFGATFYLNRSQKLRPEVDNRIGTIAVISEETAPPAAKAEPVQATKSQMNSEALENLDKSRELSRKEVEEIRSKTKTFLTALYMSQMAFHAEHNNYVTDIVALGISTETVLPFKGGFLESSGNLPEVSPEANIDTRRLNTDFLIGERDQTTNEAIQYAPFAREIDLAAYKDFCKHGCTAGTEGFEMLIATPLGNPDQVDVWLVNDKKEFILVKDGTESRIK